MELVYMYGNHGFYTTSDIKSECVGITHHAIIEHIRKQKDRLEKYGIIAFKMGKIDGRVRPEKFYHLNNRHTTLLITFLKNTDYDLLRFKKICI